MPRSQRSEGAALSQVVAGAREAFARYGVHRTRMEDVAKAAGIARSHVYNLVSSKEELVELALLERNREFGEEMREVATKSKGDVATAIVDLMLYGIEIGRGDAEFQYLAEAIPRVRLQNLLTGTGSPMHPMVADAFEPLLERARSEGRLREGLSQQDRVHWLALVLSVLTPSEDSGEADQRRLLTTFFTPALLRD